MRIKLLPVKRSKKSLESIARVASAGVDGEPRPADPEPDFKSICHTPSPDPEKILSFLMLDRIKYDIF